MSRAPRRALVDAVTSLAQVSRAVVERDLANAGAQAGGDNALALFTNLVRQAPASDSERERLLGLLRDSQFMDGTVTPAEIDAASRLLRECAPRVPEAESLVNMPPLDPNLAGAVESVMALERAVPEPWALVGGLMVMLHCVEHEVPFSRATSDADIALGVFTHRGALRRVSGVLRDMNFVDTTPRPLASDDLLSYRWEQGVIKVDLMVPERVNEQTRVPTTVTHRPAIELPAIQQALARTQRLHVRLADGAVGVLRRPDLLGALTMKAVAAVTDRRNPGRHVVDLVALSDALASSGGHVRYARVLRPKDVARLRKVYALLTDEHWRRAADPEAAREALGFISTAKGKEPV